MVKSSLQYEDKKLLFGESATLGNGAYQRDNELIAWQKKSLFEYIRGLAFVLHKVKHGGLVFTRSAGTPKDKEPFSSIYKRSFSRLQEIQCSKHILNVNTSFSQIEEDIHFFIDNKVFADPEHLTDFNWFFVDAPLAAIEDEVRNNDQYKTMKTSDYDNQVKKLIYIDVDIKDQYAFLKDTFSFTDEKDFKTNVKYQEASCKLSALRNAAFFAEIKKTHPVDCVFTGSGLHCGYLIKDAKPWAKAKAVRDDHRYKPFYERIIQHFSQNVKLDPKCIDPNRLRRLPFTYNYKPDSVDDSPEAAVLSVLIEDNAPDPDMNPALDATDPLFQFAASFIAVTAGGTDKTDKKASHADKVDTFLAGNKDQSKSPYSIQARFLQSPKVGTLLSKIRMKRRQEKSELSKNNPTFGEVFDFFNFSRSKSGYYPTDKETTQFVNCTSPFRYKLSDKDQLNESEETIPSFRYNDGTGRWYDFGQIPTYTGEPNGDIFALIYLLHLKSSGVNRLPEYIEEDSFDVIVNLISKMLQLDKIGTLDTLYYVPEDPSRYHKGKRFLMENVDTYKAVAFNNLISKYEFICDLDLNEFLVRERGTQQPYRNVENPGDLPDFVDMLNHLERPGFKQKSPELYFVKYTAGGVRVPLNTFGNLKEVCKKLAEETFAALDPDRYIKENEDVYDNNGNIVDTRSFKVYKIADNRDPNTGKYKDKYKIPMFDPAKIILAFNDNTFFHVQEAKEITEWELKNKHSLCRLVPIDTPFPRKSYAEMHKPLLDMVLGSLFSIYEHKNNNKIVLQYILGCLFSRPHGQTRAVILKDLGGSGKSTFLDVIKKILPEEIHTEINLVNIGDDSNTAGTARAALRNKCLAVVSDLARYTLPIGLKQYITGDKNAIQYRPLYKDAKYMTNNAFILMLGNSIPKITKDYAAFSRRLIILELNPRDSSKLSIPNLAEQIVKEESEAFMAMVLESIQLFKQYQFTFPCDKLDKAAGRFLPRAQDLIVNTITHIQEAVGLGTPMALLTYCPGSVVKADMYIQACIEEIKSKESTHSQDFIGRAPISNFIEEMLSELSKYSDKFNPNNFDRKLLPTYYPPDAELPPIIFVRESSGTLAYIINATIKDMSVYRTTGASVPGGRITMSSNTIQITSLFESILPAYNKRLTNANRGDYRYSAVSPTGNYLSSDGIYDELVRLGNQIKERQETIAYETATNIRGNVTSISALTEHKNKTRRPLLRKKQTGNKGTQEEVKPFAKVAGDPTTSITQIDFDL